MTVLSSTPLSRALNILVVVVGDLRIAKYAASSIPEMILLNVYCKPKGLTGGL
jgi:hypothetical protein